MPAHNTRLVAKIDPLKYLLSKANLIVRLEKWMIILSEFDVEYVERKAIKGQAIVDQLAEFPLKNDVSMQIEFLDCSIMHMTERTWKMFFDGSHKQNGASAGILFITPHGYTIPKSYKLLFPCTNNIVEYEALANGIKIAIEWRIIEMHIFGDSQLVINQVNNDYQTKDDKLVPYKKLFDALKNYFTFVTFQQIAKTENKATNAMANLEYILQLQDHESWFEFLVEELHHPTYDSPDSQVICTIIGHELS